MRSTITLSVLSAGFLTVLSQATSGQPPQIKPEEAVSARQGLMTAVKWQFAPLSTVAKGDAPLDAGALDRAVNLAALARVYAEAFPAGSQRAARSRALPAVWDRPEDFRRAMAAFQTTTAALAEAARAGRSDAFRSRFQAVAGTCKDCHELFRAPDQP